MAAESEEGFQGTDKGALSPKRVKEELVMFKLAVLDLMEATAKCLDTNIQQTNV